MAAEKNPYMSENETPTRRRGAHFATPPAPEPYEPPRRKRSKAPIVLILLLAALVAGGVLCVRRYGTDFTSYPVIGELLSRFGSGEEKITVTVNGEETKVAAGSTVQAVFDSVKPGVTGYAAVYGRNSLPWHDRLALDVEYVRNVTFAMDAKVFARTFTTVFNQEGIYVEE